MNNRSIFTSSNSSSIQQSFSNLPTILRNFIIENNFISDKTDREDQQSSLQSMSRSNLNHSDDKRDDIFVMNDNNKSIVQIPPTSLFRRTQSDEYTSDRSEQDTQPIVFSAIRSAANRQATNSNNDDTNDFRDNQLFNYDGNEDIPTSPDEQLARTMQQQEWEQDYYDDTQNDHRKQPQPNDENNRNPSPTLAAALYQSLTGTNEDNDFILAEQLQQQETASNNFLPFFNPSNNNDEGSDTDNFAEARAMPLNILMRRMIQHDRSNRVRRPNGNNVRNLQQFQGDFSSEDYETLLQLDEITGANKQKLNKNQINQISTDKFNKSSSSQSASSEENTCSICYDNFEDGQTLHIYPCIHKFHQDCSSRWLSENNVCPVCRLPPVTVENTARRTIHRSHNRPHQTNNNTSRRN